MKLKLTAGSTSRTLKIFIQDSTSTSGAGLTGLVYNSGGLTWYYIREGDSSPTAVTAVTATVGTFTSSGFKEVDATNMPGVYELGVPNAAIATGAKTVHMMLKGATNMVPVLIEIELDVIDYNVNIADGILDRNMATGTDSGGRTVRNALRVLRNKVDTTGGTLSVKKEDDSTEAWNATLTTNGSADPITIVDPS